MARSRRSKPGLLDWMERIAGGVLPTADGGPPPAMQNARTRLSWIRWSAVGLLSGGVIGILLALLILGVPSWPVAVLAFGGGVLVGTGLGFALASKVPAIRAGGAAAILLAPLLIVFLPFVLIGALFALLRRWPEAPAPSPPPEGPTPLEPGARPARRASPRRRA